LPAADGGKLGFGSQSRSVVGSDDLEHGKYHLIKALV
jgi:hypothetical protein